ncbi:MAG: hypothetical protein ACI4TX_03085, partial [Christensenellales bacterium]
MNNNDDLVFYSSENKNHKSGKNKQLNKNENQQLKADENLQLKESESLSFDNDESLNIDGESLSIKENENFQLKESENLQLKESESFDNGECVDNKENEGLKLETIIGKCEYCGNAVKYSPEDAGLKCEHCLRAKKIDFSANNVKLPCENVVDDILKWQKAEKYINCKNCGSKILLLNNEISINCPYCNTQNVVLQKDIGGICPHFIVPFAFDESEA